ncbi:MAG: TRAM domain-containing protein [Propionibacteriaceae bacterium]|nr:TRAM domain-containing protein [Propionibacteriaceae bacterium]
MNVLRLEGVAHGGMVVGRIDGKVIFVTGGLPGELVEVEVTERGKRFDRGVVVRVLEAAPGRVEPGCPVAGECGGCDWQHADAATQRELKRAVVAEQLAHLAGLDWQGEVEEVTPRLGWRTRMRYAVEAGRVGLRGRRSRRVVPLPEQGCQVALGPSPLELQGMAPDGELSVVVSDGAVSVLAGRRVLQGPEVVHQQAGGRRYQVSAGGFWQVHPRAADTLLEAVLTGLAPRAGETALDLCCGAGLFAGGLDAAGVSVFGVELDARAVAHARNNVPGARFLASSLARALPRLPGRVDLVVLDPPRRGAGAEVVNHVAGLGPRAIAHVACDPASLGRDLGLFRERGYEPHSIRAFDLFPMTHHVECVAILQRHPRH